MAGDEQREKPASVGDRFPRLKQREEAVERAKLDQALSEARAATAKANVPDLDVEIARDSLAVSDKATGLARVFVQMDAIALADDIADITLDAARKAATEDGTTPPSYNIRVVSDPGILGSVDVYRLLVGQLEELNRRLNQIAPAKKEETKQQPRAGAEVAGLVAAAGVGVQVIGLASKLFAREYHVSSREVPVDELGFDLQVAHYLASKKKSDETINVEVERVRPTAEDSGIVEDVWKLARSTEERLAPVISERAQTLAEAQSGVERDKASIAASSAEILKLMERVPEKAEQPVEPKKTASGAGPLMDVLRELTDRRKQLEEALPAREREVAAALSTHEQATALLRDVEDFLTAALTPGKDGRRAPMLDAARVESLVAGGRESKDRYLLFARLVAGGVDQTIETKLGPDRSSVLAGASAEFALLGREGRLLVSGVRPALQASTWKLDDPDSFRQSRPSYMAQDRARTVSPTPPQNPSGPSSAGTSNKGRLKQILGL